jgi:hypothetical protein
VSFNSDFIDCMVLSSINARQFYSAILRPAGQCFVACLRLAHSDTNGQQSDRLDLVLIDQIIADV